MTSPTFQLEELINKFKGLQILVAGDPMYDIYHFGRVDRMCPEAPVPVFIEDRWQRRLGGAANVAENLRALGCKVETLFPAYEWVEKNRYMVGSHQLLRIDREQHYEVDWSADCSISWPLTKFHAVVISDYAKGSCTEANCRWLIQLAFARRLPVIVDPKGDDWNKYIGANIICPNEKEWLWDQGQVQPMFDYVVLKRGAQGIRLFDHEKIADFPAKARHVFDVTGAGDTVTAVIAAVRAAGGNIVQAVELANLAAAVVVGEVGTSTCSAERLIQEIHRS